MSTDPTSLFLAAALAAGLVEGSSVIRYHRHALSLGNAGAGDNDSGDDCELAVPSASVVAAHSILYGIASVPLGIVGASPGHVFLPKSLSSRIRKCHDGDAPAVEDTKNAEEEKAMAKNLNTYSSALEEPPMNLSDAPVVGTGRGVGRMLRRENSRKMALRNEMQRRPQTESAKERKTGAVHANRIRRPPSTGAGVPSRFVATLDGRPLPAPLAEAMRRSRCAFVGAGIVSYALMMTSSARRRDQCESSGNRQRDENFARGYSRWVNAESVGLWNERIKNGKSMDEVDLLKRWRMVQDGEPSAQSPFDDNAITFGKMNDSVLGGIYKATRWLNVQLGRDLDEPPLSLIGHWKMFDTLESMDGGASNEEDDNSRSTTDGEGTQQGGTSSSPESDPQLSQRSPNKVLNAVMTSVGVLGTSVRHLMVSTYRFASVVATMGRKGESAPKGEDDVTREVQRNQTSFAGGCSDGDESK